MQGQRSSRTLDSASLRPATPEIAEVAARLLFLTMGPLAGYWMGVDEEHAATAILSRLFRARSNLFSHGFATYAEVEGKTAGIEVSYAAGTMKALEGPTLWQFLPAAGLRATIRMLWRSYPLQSITDAGPDEYFLAHLGVLPEHEGRGIGRQLLQRAEERARQAALGKLTLTVDADNDRAMRLYRRAGFTVAATISLGPLRRRFGYHGYHHMVKTLS